MPRAQENRFQKIYFILWGICFSIILVAFFSYKLGFRLTTNLTPVKVGSIEITANQNDLTIFMDNREHAVIKRTGGYVIANVTPGFHAILVSKDGFWPWTKTVSVGDRETRSLYAFIFPMRGASVSPVPKGPAYEKISKSIERQALPEPKPGSSPWKPDELLSLWIRENVPNAKISTDKSTALYVEHDTLHVVWISETEPPPHYFCEKNPCTFEMPVFTSNQPIKEVGFYKNRNDLIIFASGAALYGIEVSREGTQNFQPLYRGTNPYFEETDSGIFYIKDGENVLTATL